MSNEVQATHEQETSIRALLDLFPESVVIFREAIIRGRVRGDAIWDHGCGCIWGWLERARHKGPFSFAIYTNVENDKRLFFGSKDEWCPAEYFVEAIRPGHTPGNSPRSAELLRIVDAWLAEQDSEHVGAPAAQVEVPA